MASRSTRLRSLTVAALGLLAACSVSSADGPGRPVSGLEVHPDLPLSHPPFDHVAANWKHRLAQPYAYLEARGSYTQVGALLSELVTQAQRQGLTVDGPPFALYYDDPGRVPVDELRLRACLPIAGSTRPLEPLAFDVLPSTTVVYAFASGPYPEVPRAYAGLYRYLSELGWREDGPIRESYLVNPGEVSDFAQLVTEIQIPAASAR
jgi:effector-binding domain-containing protein